MSPTAADHQREDEVLALVSYWNRRMDGLGFTPTHTPTLFRSWRRKKPQIMGFFLLAGLRHGNGEEQPLCVGERGWGSCRAGFLPDTLH